MPRAAGLSSERDQEGLFHPFPPVPIEVGCSLLPSLPLSARLPAFACAVPAAQSTLPLGPRPPFRHPGPSGSEGGVLASPGTTVRTRKVLGKTVRHL